MTPLVRDVPRIVGTLPGPRAPPGWQRDDRVMSPSYTRIYPLVVRRGTRGDDRGHRRQSLPRLHGRHRRDRRPGTAIPGSSRRSASRRAG